MKLPLLIDSKQAKEIKFSKGSFINHVENANGSDWSQGYKQGVEDVLHIMGITELKLEKIIKSEQKVENELLNV